jgi:sugar phosphate isomerase/epimerase
MKKLFYLIAVVLAGSSFPIGQAIAEAKQNPHGVGTSKDFHGPVGVQLYSLHDTLVTNVLAGLKAIRDLGFVEVELAGSYGLPAQQFRSLLEANKLVPVSGLWDYAQFATNLTEAVRVAKFFGVKYAGCATIQYKGDFDEKTCREAAAVFNRAGQALAKEGIRFVYHNHGYEFVPYKDGTLFDLLVSETDPRYVSFEMDVFWTVFPAQDPKALLKKYPNRWALMHVKDMRKGLKTGSLGGTSNTNCVVIGSGQIDMPGVLRAAQEIGVKHYFIEDESPNPKAQIPQSLEFLSSMSW